MIFLFVENYIKYKEPFLFLLDLINSKKEMIKTFNYKLLIVNCY